MRDRQPSALGRPSVLDSTAASVVSKLEAGGDVKFSTLQRYCAAIGEKLSVAV
jgi:hypothetical protein